MSSTEEQSNGGVGGGDLKLPIVANGDHGESATTDAPSITAVLEAANTLRKVDEKVDEILADTTPVEAVANNNGKNGATSTPTIDDIANALSEPNNLVYTADDDDDDSLPDNDNVGSKPAYSSQTAAAISYLMKSGETTTTGESSSLIFSSNNNNANRGQSSSEISLQDRASAMISVYKDYIVQQQEGEEEQQQQHYELPLLEERRKEEIKLFTLEKFCGDNQEENNEEGEGEESDNDDDEVGSDDAAAYYDGSDDNMSIDSHEKLNGRSKIDKYKTKKPKFRKPRLHVPTAATTTAAFRLKAEVALKAVGDTAKKASAAVAVKTTKVGGRHLMKGQKKKTKDGMQDDDMNMAETIENEHDYQDYVTRDYDDDNDGDIDQDEMQDDLEYGIHQQHQIRINEDGTEDGGIYGMHILDRDNSLKRTRRSAAAQDEENDPDVEAVGIFNDLCDELGVTPDTHPGLHNGLHHFYHQPRSTRYKYPIFRTKKFKKAMFGALLLLLVLLIGVAIISAISNGFETVRQKKAPPLPDWKSEIDWEEHQKLNWEAHHPSSGNDNNINRPTHPAITSQQKLFQKVSAAYRPIWYDRSTGWTGQTYAESITWCDSHDNYIPCPYEVYCPDEKNLLSGITDDEEGESWAPVVNSENEWVQVGNAAGVCDLYSNRYGERPIWGTNGVNDEKITRHIMCCREHPMEEGGKPAAEDDGQHVVKADAPPDNWHVFESATKTYNPIWFDRDKGWNGQTYQDSLDFCAKQMDGYMPCPLDAYCPGGRGKLLGGIKENEGESWSAVIDAANDWVQVAEGGECNLYSETAKELPSWGITGENNEEITRHIMCCDVLGKLLSGDDSSTAAVDNNISAPPLVILPKPHRPMTELEVRVTETHHPAWFSTESGSGYKGTTYNDARAFCESIPVGEGDTYHLCPLSAYCPNGPTDTEPLYLQQKSFDGVQWAPISNEENGWIMVGTFNEQPQLTCQTYQEIHNSDPEWGLDGTSPELKTNILCCKGESAEVQDSSSNNASLPNSQNDEQPASNNEEPASIMKPASMMTSSEIQIQDTYHPAWFSKAFGWQGTTYNDAKAFCESIPNGDGGSTLHLCPFSAYCPNGPRETEQLYLHMDAFDGVQWAPISNEENEWVMIGDTADLTCKTYLEINHHEPSWGLDGDEIQLKEHLLCCEDKTFNANAVASIQEGALSSVSNSDTQVDGPLASTTDVASNQGGHESSLTSTFNPQWFTADNGGWEGGSHSEAVEFCQQFAGSHGKKMELCPYAVYCPNGPSNSVIGGHDANFDKQGEQWAPVFGQANHWVMIGMRGTNKSTTCLSHVQLTGEEPSWGIDGSSKEKKLHIMCCSPLQ